MKTIINDPQKYKAAIYARLSKEDEEKMNGGDASESIKNQLALLRNFCEENNLYDSTEYVDDGYSGTNTDRPLFQKMLQDIKDDKINMVITKDFSRLGRDRISFGYLTECYFPEHDVRYIAVCEDYDSINGCNDQVAAFKSLMNEMYAADTSKKVTNTKRYKQQQGLFIGGKAPFGYVKSPTEKNKIVIDEYAAGVVKYIFELALSGISCRQIAVRLNEQNIPTPAQYAKINLSVKGPYSGKWSSERISDMLQNEVYIGNMVQGRVRKVSYKSKKCKKLKRDEWTVVQNTHEAIISKEVFEKVGELIKSRNYTRSCTYDYLLKGLIFCYECGYPLGVIKRKLSGDREVMYFVCRTYQRFTKDSQCTCHCVRLEDVTNAVIEQVRMVCKKYLKCINMGELTSKAELQLYEEMKKRDISLSALRSELETIQLKIDNAYDDKLSGRINNEVFLRIYQRYSNEQSDIRKKITELENSGREIPSIDEKRVKEIAERFIETKEISRELLVSLIDRIELTEDKEVKIFFKFSQMEITNRL